jgi:hypothetical protein
VCGMHYRLPSSPPSTTTMTMCTTVCGKATAEPTSPLRRILKKGLDYGDIYNRLDGILGLSYSGGYHEKRTSDGKLEFKIWNLDVDIRNAPFASSDQVSARFKADSTIMLEVPVSFGGKLLPPMRIKVKTSAGYTPRF